MVETEIAWTDSTFNPWWGCFKISRGCDNCYAATFDKRVHGIGKGHWGPQAEHRRFGDKHWADPVKWNAAAAKAGVRHKVFCASMADVFEGRDEDAADRARLFALIEATPWLDWQLLTKRPENMVRLAPASWAGGWPANVWAGCTVEDQQRADERIGHLFSTPAKTRFLSVEPLLAPVDLSRYVNAHCVTVIAVKGQKATIRPNGRALHWVIVGGESGHGARPFDLAWARSIVAQCQAAGVPCFVKQLGAKPIETDSFHDGTEPCCVFDIKDRKGGDPSEWPEDLRVRQFPEVRA